MNVLISWLGKTDWEQAKQGNHASIAKLLLSDEKQYDKIYILDNNYQDEWEAFRKRLIQSIKKEKRNIPEIIYKSVKIKSPIDFESIASVVSPLLDELTSHKVTINFSSGTPAMASISVLLGYIIHETQLVQVNRDGEITNVRLPFNFKGEYLKQEGNRFEQLIGGDPKIESAFEEMTVHSKIMSETVLLAKRIAPIDITCLILGETGTGKEMMAKAICKASDRNDEPIVVNCGAIPETLIDSELFGTTKSSFTGATDRKGKFEAANGGTIFLDEIGELSLDAQTRLLRVLQEGKITRVGATKEIPIDVRVIAATHRNLAQMVVDGTFREDLFYRIAIGIIELPALRERNEDIMDIAEELLKEINDKYSNKSSYISKKFYKDVNEFIKSYDWPGNVRELKNTLARAIIWSNDEYISSENLEKSLLKREGKSVYNFNAPYIPSEFDVDKYIDNVKKSFAEQAMLQTCDRNTDAAKLLGSITRPTINNWLALD